MFAALKTARPFVSALALGAMLGVSMPGAIAPAAAADAMQPAPAGDGPRVTVEPARSRTMTESVMVTGTLIARDEILVGPEIDGLRVVEILAEDGDKVAQGQVLARLNRDTLEAVLAQNDAALLRVDAAIAQARSQIAQAEAAATQTRQALARTTQLRQSGFAAQANFDTLTQEEKAARARLDAARQGLNSAEAEKASVQAQRREVELRMQRTEVKAPAAGIISRRTAKLGAVASMAAEPMFRLIADGDIELEAEVPETRISTIKVGNPAVVRAGGVETTGQVRLVSTEVDRATRTGKVRVAIGNDTGLKIGAFARGEIRTQTAEAVAVPLAAVLYGASGPFVQVVREKKIVSTPVKLGITMGPHVSIVSGLAEGAYYVAKAGAFLRDGDAVQPVTGDSAKAGAQ